MPQETELHVDDGTYFGSLALQCTGPDCGSEYLVRGSKAELQTENGALVEYPFICPKCSSGVFLRLPLAQK